jgi:Uma2 family endonuclease
MEQIAEAKRQYSIEEYFALEIANRETKYEFLDGEILAMAGAELAHNTICANIIGELRNEVIKKQKNCRVLTSDQRVRAYRKEENKWGYFYPDVALVCGTPELADTTPKTLLNPSVLIEVLSKSNSTREVMMKLKFYRAIDSLSDVLLVDSESQFVMHFERVAEGDWLMRSWSSATETITLKTHDITLLMSEIYREVEFQTQKI